MGKTTVAVTLALSLMMLSQGCLRWGFGGDSQPPGDGGGDGGNDAAAPDARGDARSDGRQDGLKDSPTAPGEPGRDGPSPDAPLWDQATSSDSGPADAPGSDLPFPDSSSGADLPPQAPDSGPPSSTFGQTCTPDDWCWENPLPHGNPLTDIWGTDPDNVYAVGLNGVIMHYNGIEWSTDASVTPFSRYGVWASGQGDLVVVGRSLLRFDGSSWSETTPGPSFSAVWGSGPDNVLAVGSNGNIYRWQGAFWQQESSVPTNENLNAVWGRSASDIWVAGDNGTVLQYDGSQWAPHSFLDSPAGKRFRDLWGAPSSGLVLVGDQGLVVAGTSAVASELVSPGSGFVDAVWASAPDDFWVGGQDLLRHYQGGGWSPVLPSIQGSISGLWGSAAADIWAAGAHGRIYHYLGVGGWSAQGSGPVDAHLYDVCVAESGVAFAVGEQGAVYRRTGGGWVSMTGPNTNADLHGVWCDSPSNIWVAGESGYIAHFDGAQWTPWISETNEDLLALSGCSAKLIFAGGFDGALVFFNGHSWNPVGAAQPEQYYAVHCLGPGEVLVGTENKVAHLVGATWVTKTLSLPATVGGAHVSGVWGDLAGNVAAVDTDGTIYHSATGSATGVTDLVEVESSIYQLFSVWGSGATDIYAGGSIGTLYHYDGLGWSKEQTACGATLNGLGGSSPGEVYAVGSDGTVLRKIP